MTSNNKIFKSKNDISNQRSSNDSLPSPTIAELINSLAKLSPSNASFNQNDLFQFLKEIDLNAFLKERARSLSTILTVIPFPTLKLQVNLQIRKIKSTNQPQPIIIQLI